MFKKVTALLLAGMVFALAGCNTVGGVGEDVQAAGNAIENGANGAKRY